MSMRIWVGSAKGLSVVWNSNRAKPMLQREYESDEPRALHMRSIPRTGHLARSHRAHEKMTTSGTRPVLFTNTSQPCAAWGADLKTSNADLSGL